MCKNIVNGLVLCLLLSIPIGCASKGRDASAGSQSGTAKIYVLRRLTALGGGGITISDNGKQIGTIHRGGIITWKREPGTVVVEASGATDAKLSTVVEANQVYFIEVRSSRAASPVSGSRNSFSFKG
jgi:hypothetical protein